MDIVQLAYLAREVISRALMPIFCGREAMFKKAAEAMLILCFSVLEWPAEVWCSWCLEIVEVCKSVRGLDKQSATAR